MIGLQERRLLSTGDLIHVVDHPDGSYLQEAKVCGAAFEARPIKKLTHMPTRLARVLPLDAVAALPIRIAIRTDRTVS